MKKLFYIGLDVHRDTIVIAVARSGREPAMQLATIPHDVVALLKLLDDLGPRSQLRVCYEAGPTGYGLSRRLNESVSAASSSRLRWCPCNRVAGSRRTAAMRSSWLTSCGRVTWSRSAIPAAQNEAMRDLERAREDAVQAQRVARHQLSKFLLRYGRVWGGTAIGLVLTGVGCSSRSFPKTPCDACGMTICWPSSKATARIDRLTRDIEELVEQWALGPLVKALQALRGVQLVTATVLAAEIGDFARFSSPRQLMAYLGLVPSEHSSGSSRRQGGITHAGNRHARWILIEAAWNYRFGPRPSKAIAARRRQVAAGVRTIAEKAEDRLHRRFTRLTHRGKKSQAAVTAVARELVGFVWAIAREERLLAA